MSTLEPPAIRWAAAAGAVTGGPTYTLWASCTGGLETQTAVELAALGWRPVDPPPLAPPPSGVVAGLSWEEGSVYGQTDLAGVYRTLWSGRTLTRVALLLGAACVHDLEGLAGTVRAIELEGVPGRPFAVRAERRGEHPFRSPDMARVAGQAIIDSRLARTGRRPPVDLERPEIVFRVELNASRLRVGLDLTERSLHRRAWRVHHHMAGLKPTTAAALLLMADWRRTERLLDPMCGTATIPVEAALATARRSPNPRAVGRLQALGVHDEEIAERVRTALRDAVLEGAAAPILGIDRFARHVHDARGNAASARVDDAVEIRRGDATRLDGVGEVDVVVVNPPYGSRAGNPRIIEPLYRRSLAAIAEHLAPGGRIVILTPALGLIRASLGHAGLEETLVRPVGLGSLEVYACLLHRR